MTSSRSQFRIFIRIRQKLVFCFFLNHMTKSFFYPFSVNGPKMFASNQNPDKKALWIRLKSKSSHVPGKTRFSRSGQKSEIDPVMTRNLPLCSKFFSYAYSCVDFSRMSFPPPLFLKKATRSIIFSTRKVRNSRVKNSRARVN